MTKEGNFASQIMKNLRTKKVTNYLADSIDCNSNDNYGITNQNIKS